MSAWRDHYPPDLYPGFWECLDRYSTEGMLVSVDRVYSEILSPNELKAWVDRNWLDSFGFSGDGEVVVVYSEMQSWVQANHQFSPAAKDEFAAVADGWLAAYAKVHDAVVVTHEVFDPNVKRRVPLANLCRQFSVPYVNTVGMLRGLGARFDLRQSLPD